MKKLFGEYSQISRMQNNKTEKKNKNRQLELGIFLKNHKQF